MLGDHHNPHKVLPDGRGLWLIPLTYGRYRIGIGEVPGMFFDDVY